MTCAIKMHQIRQFIIFLVGIIASLSPVSALSANCPESCVCENVTISCFHIKNITAGIFQDFRYVTRLSLGAIDLPEGVFDNLTELRDLSISCNTLPSRNLFRDQSLLQNLAITMPIFNAGKTNLPTGVFAGLVHLTNLTLTIAIDTIPEGLLQPLTSMKSLTLKPSAPTMLPEDFFDNSSGLEELYILNADYNGWANLTDRTFAKLTPLTLLSLSSTFIGNVSHVSLFHTCLRLRLWTLVSQSSSALSPLDSLQA